MLKKLNYKTLKDVILILIRKDGWLMSFYNSFGLVDRSGLLTVDGWDDTLFVGSRSRCQVIIDFLRCLNFHFTKVKEDNNNILLVRHDRLDEWKKFGKN